MINIIAWYLIIALNISRVMTIRFIFSVIILIKIQKFEKKEEDVLCISWLVTTVFFFFSLWAWDLKQWPFKNVSILYCTPCELMTTGNLGTMSVIFFYQKNYVCIIGFCLRSIHRTFLWIKIGSGWVGFIVTRNPTR